MARKGLVIDPLIGNGRVGFGVFRIQGLHHRHAALMFRMIADNGRNIVGIGSVQKSGESGNPFSADQRRQAVAGLLGDKMKIVMLQDIGATDEGSEWSDYVFDRIAAAGLPEPTDFYSGSRHDARWYEDRFMPLRGDPDRVNDGVMTWESGGKRVHIMDRSSGEVISSSEVRAMIERRDPEWKLHVPGILHDFYERNYPGHLRVAVTLAEGDPMPGLETYPVGTKLLAEGMSEVVILRADGKWRPRSEAESRKSMGD